MILPFCNVIFCTVNQIGMCLPITINDYLTDKLITCEDEEQDCISRIIINQTIDSDWQGRDGVNQKNVFFQPSEESVSSRRSGKNLSKPD